MYPLNTDGNAAPLRTIRSPPRGKEALATGNPGAVGYDTKRNRILVFPMGKGGDVSPSGCSRAPTRACGPR